MAAIDSKQQNEKVIERVKALIDNAKKQGHIIIRLEDIENSFPELKESEDERKRKAILTGLIDCRDAPDLGWSNFGGINIDECIAWLEKQVEKDKPKTWCAEDDQNLNVVLSFIPDECLRRWLKDKLCYDMKDILPYEVSRQVYQIAWDCGKTFEQSFALLAASHKAYQRGKKDAKKELKILEDNKSKFKVGDFIINDYCLGKVIEITNDAYLLDTGQGIPFSCKNTHLWAIEDAKDGDVLDCEGCEYLLFKSFSNTDGRIKLYCWYNVQTNNFYGRGTDSKLRREANIQPATKEQRDLLFSKMKEAGYEWDSEKKELKKIEPKFKVGNWYQCTKDFFGKGVTFDKNTAYYCAKEGCLLNEYGCHIAIVKDLYDNFKLWTIQDAKDGDVLVSKDDRPFIFTGEFDVQDDNPTAYCGINSNDKFITGKGSHWTFKDGIKPATKNQRDTLFAKMKEAGYEWDSEKKELKKIEAVSKESKDERMMEQLCDFLRDNMLYQDAQEITSWLEKLLEKQGQQMTTSKSK